MGPVTPEVAGSSPVSLDIPLNIIMRGVWSLDSSNLSPKPAQLEQVSAQPATDTLEAANVSCANITSADLFWTFLQVGLYGFGGIAAIGRHMIVERRKWLNEQDYAALLGLCQILPGGNVLNVAAILGDRYCGPAGAFWAVAGLFAMPLLILVAIAGIYDQIADLPDVQAAIAGAAAAASGLLIGTSVKMMRALKLRLLALTFALIAFLAVAIFRLPLVWTLAVLMPLCLAATFWERRR